eukprot:365811-Chlamydomonas_euryale.AAC.20
MAAGRGGKGKGDTCSRHRVVGTQGRRVEEIQMQHSTPSLPCTACLRTHRLQQPRPPGLTAAAACWAPPWSLSCPAAGPPPPPPLRAHAPPRHVLPRWPHPARARAPSSCRLPGPATVLRACWAGTTVWRQPGCCPQAGQAPSPSALTGMPPHHPSMAALRQAHHPRGGQQALAHPTNQPCWRRHVRHALRHQLPGPRWQRSLPPRSARRPPCRPRLPTTRWACPVQTCHRNPSAWTRHPAPFAWARHPTPCAWARKRPCASLACR